MVKKQLLLGLPFLCVVFGAMAGCKTSVPQPPRVETAGMRVDVTKVSKETRRQRLEVRIRLWNDHDQRISFEPANVRLLWNSREVSAVNVNANEGRGDVQAKSGRDFRWYFELGEAAAEGTYPVEIRDIRIGDVPLGDTVRFAINLGA